MLLWSPTPARAEEPEAPHAEPTSRESAPASPEPVATVAPDFETYLDWQASTEVEIGLRLFDEGDDYRAITSIKRYRLLSGTPDSDHLAALLIGEIYRRNAMSELAMQHFFDASRSAPNAEARLQSYLLGLQELCLNLGAIATCYETLVGLQARANEDAPGLEELLRYQTLFVESLLRSPGVTEARADTFDDPALAGAARELVARHRAFDSLKLKQPWLAATLSALIPGAGQLYNGRPVDALLALGFTGIFGAASVYAYRGLDSIPLTVAAGLLALGFYSGNIANALVDAKRINATRYQRYYDELQTDLWARQRFEVRESAVIFSFGFDWPALTPEPATPPSEPPIPDML
ncbi:hypothetical protein EA187_01080 [Lujinxingia sediminis]|uniref:DUF5683 domain-containing protein n=1 Tax=Lujinxingia sediminis TaxID=2480984 RepID=A0ABY0CXB2_9DELT|nr:hypothetical protein [Lujinxingia sediminis]RVU48060.1 hypothetical protein EA187_01080 [Lujinxingia sediminis]